MDIYEIKAYSHKVHYYETDQMGIVHHSNYIRWFEEARTDFLEQAGFGYGKMEKCGILSPVLSVFCQYKSMVYFNDIVYIIPKIENFHGVKFDVSYRIFDGVTGLLRTTGESKHCLLGRDRRPIKLLKENKDVYDIFTNLIGYEIELPSICISNK